MKKGHAGFWIGALVFFIAVVYSIILFLVKPNLDLSAKILYGSTMLAFLLVGIQIIAVARGGAGVVMDAALGVITAIYFGIQFLLGGIVCMCFSDLPLTAVVVAEIILLAVYLVCAFVMYAAQSKNAAQRINTDVNIGKIRVMENEVLAMMDQQSDATTKKALKSLAEAIHYSVPQTHPVLMEIEGKIAKGVMELQEGMYDDEIDSVAQIKAIIELIKERDRLALSAQ